MIESGIIENAVCTSKNCASNGDGEFEAAKKHFMTPYSGPIKAGKDGFWCFNCDSGPKAQYLKGHAEKHNLKRIICPTCGSKVIGKWVDEDKKESEPMRPYCE